MAPAGFYTGPSRRLSQDQDMDVIAILLAVVVFAVLYALIFGIERI
jgi:hypothetical protein